MPWGEEGQDIFQRPRVHIGIHMSTPFPQKALQGQAQPRATGGQILAPAPSESSPSLKWVDGSCPFQTPSLFVLASAPWSCEGQQAETWVAVVGPLLGSL